MSEKTKFDTIVIGAGMSGGWAAKEFCDKGFKTLLLERGRDVQHIKDYPTAMTTPWEFEHRGKTSYKDKTDNPVINRCYNYNETSEHFFVKDTDHPYIQDKPFDWIRGYQVGGKSLMWARQVQRWSDYDFNGPKRDNFAVDWPIRYKDIEDWYTKVEQFIGVSGNRDGLDALPDGDFLKAWDLNCIETHFQDVIKKNYSDRHLIYARCAHLTETKDIHLEQGRGLCQNRNLCERGCPYGGYFNANTTLIPWAKKTGNLTLRPHSVVHSIIYDEQQKKAVGVNVIDAQTKEKLEYFAEVIFVNAATLNTNLILLNSTSKRFPNGLGNDNGLLGKYIGFHNYKAFVNAFSNKATDKKMISTRPTSTYIPRFRNLYKQDTDFLRGYAVAFYTERKKKINTTGFGSTLLNNLMETGHQYLPWKVGAGMMGETIPKEENQVTLDSYKTDDWGIPLLHISVGYDENDRKMVADFHQEFSRMFKEAGFTDIETINTDRNPGLDIHEMGGVRMGNDPRTSLVNKWNQLHLCKNVFITDGACMTSFATQNPSLTFMALTARAANYAMEQIQKGTLL